MQRTAYDPQYSATRVRDKRTYRMKALTLRNATLMLALLALCAGSFAYAAPKDDAVAASAAISTSADTLPEAPDTDPQSGVGPQSGVPPAPAKTAAVKTDKSAKKQNGVRPFTHPAIAIKVGVAGAGVDVALPLARKFNIRGGASFFDFDHTFTSDGTSYDASLDFKTAMIALDWYPFGGSFRMSPIAQIYNGNSVTAITTEPAPTAGSFDLGDQDYFSTTSDPVHGSAYLTMGNQGGSKVAPGFTIGWGNMIPRGKGQHWSVPFEMGFLYIQAPQIVLNFQGTACESQVQAIAGSGPSCVNMGTDPTAQSNLHQEQTDINNTLSGLRFFPVISVGLSYKF